MSNDTAPEIQKTATQAEALFDPHTALDPTMPTAPSAHVVSDDAGRIVGTKFNEHGELEVDSSNTPRWVDNVRPGDAKTTT